MLIWSSFEGSYKGLLAIGLDGSSKLRRLDLMSREGDRRTLAGRTVSAYSQPFTQQRQRQIERERKRDGVCPLFSFGLLFRVLGEMTTLWERV